MGKLIPLLIALTGLAGGLGVGFIMQPSEEDLAHSEAVEGETHEEGQEEEGHAGEAPVCPPTDAAGHSLPPAPDAPADFVKLANQFVVPVVVENDVDAMVVVTLSLEVEQGSQQEIYNMEPKLRDAFLRVLFDHANMGGFKGNFLNHLGLEALRTALRETGQKTAGPILYNVLIVDMVKQAL